MAQRRPVRERFEEKVDRDGPIPEQRPELGPCWLWTGNHFTQTGYAAIPMQMPDGKWRSQTGHRVSYGLFVGPIPAGLWIDHLCRNRGCVNPGHLEAVTPRTNILRGEAWCAVSIRTNRCIHDHEMTPENTHVRRNGKRECRTCCRIRDAKRQRTDHRREQARARYRRRKATSD